MTAPDVEDTGPFTVRDDATGRTVTVRTLGEAHRISRQLLDRFERSNTIFDIHGQDVGASESFKGQRRECD